MGSDSITLREIYAARRKIASLVRKTPLIQSPLLTNRVGAEVYLKPEILQETGSFKLRGAANKILSLPEERKSKGVITVSTGNHGRAVSYVAREAGVRATVCLSTDVPQNKVDAIQSLGAQVEIYGKSQDDAFDHAEALISQHGMNMIPPFDDPEIIAGQGTIGLELLEDMPSLDTVIVPLSGGGLISGIALALKTANPDIRVVGVSMRRAPVMYHSLKAGKPIQMEEQDTLADSLRGGIGLDNRYTFHLVQKYVDQVVLVTEEQIAQAMRFAFEEHHLVVEGGGAVGIAALLQNQLNRLGRKVVLVISGGNVDIKLLMEILQNERRNT